MSETESQRQRRRWITLRRTDRARRADRLGLGLWISWKGSGGDDKPTRVVEQRQPIPLTLRAKARRRWHEPGDQPRSNRAMPSNC